MKPWKTITLQLEHFDVEKNKWVPACSINLQIEEEPLSSGALRGAFKATCSDAGLSGGWVVKKIPDYISENHYRHLQIYSGRSYA